MNLTSVDTLAEAVLRGASYLDGRYPGWRWRIDIDKIEPACLEHNITGQLFGGNLVDQLRGAGLTPVPISDGATEADGARMMQEFCSMGFALLTATPFFPTESMRREAAATGIELPEVISIPREYDTLIMEMEALTILWEREVSKR